jgi:hypothetical protein
MKISITEKEINNKGYWDNYCKLRGMGYYSRVTDLELTFTEDEYDQLIWVKPIIEEVVFTHEQEILKEMINNVREKCNNDNLYLLLRNFKNLSDKLTLEQISNVIEDDE